MAKLWLIEDESTLQLLYRLELESMGHEVLCFDDGRSAFKLLGEKIPDLIIMDMLMPQGDGLEFLNKFVSEHFSIPIIINSGYGHYQTDYITSAADAYVTKSYDLSELIQTIEIVLDRRTSSI
jgi:DNA-binding response OmpR family regulator